MASTFVPILDLFLGQLSGRMAGVLTEGLIESSLSQQTIYGAT